MNTKSLLKEKSFRSHNQQIHHIVFSHLKKPASKVQFNTDKINYYETLKIIGDSVSFHVFCPDVVITIAFSKVYQI